MKKTMFSKQFKEADAVLDVFDEAVLSDAIRLVLNHHHTKDLPMINRSLNHSIVHVAALQKHLTKSPNTLQVFELTEQPAVYLNKDELSLAIWTLEKVAAKDIFTFLDKTKTAELTALLNRLNN